VRSIGGPGSQGIGMKTAKIWLLCVWGFTSSKQVDYESRVIEDIIKETKGKKLPQEVYERIVSNIANC